jgi:hypothetical protein
MGGGPNSLDDSAATAPTRPKSTVVATAIAKSQSLLGRVSGWLPHVVRPCVVGIRPRTLTASALFGCAQLKDKTCGARHKRHKQKSNHKSTSLTAPASVDGVNSFSAVQASIVRTLGAVRTCSKGRQFCPLNRSTREVSVRARLCARSIVPRSVALIHTQHPKLISAARSPAKPFVFTMLES